MAIRMRECPHGQRPRERLLTHGAGTLSDAELVSLLLRTGVAGRSALEVARDLITRFGGVSGLLAISPRNERPLSNHPVHVTAARLRICLSRKGTVGAAARDGGR